MIDDMPSAYRALQRLLLELAIASAEGQRLAAELKCSGQSRVVAGVRLVFFFFSSFFTFLILPPRE